MKKYIAFLFALIFSIGAYAWVAPSPMYDKMYIIGDVCNAEKAVYPNGEIAINPSLGWDLGNGVELNKMENGIFKITVELKTTCWFAFNPVLNDYDWDAWNSTRITPANGIQKAEEGSQPMMIGGTNPDSWMLSPGTYTFTVDCNTGIFNIEGNVDFKIGTIYLRGDMNGWLVDPSEEELAQWAFTTTDEVVYTLSGVSLPAAYLDGYTMVGTWKIANADWSAQFVATVENGDAYALKLNTPYFFADSDPGYNNGMAEAVENATITLDLDSETITITGNGNQGGNDDPIIDPVEINQGYAMTHVSGNIWKYTLPKGTVGMVFNNNKDTQSPSFAPVDNHVYNMSGDMGLYDEGGNSGDDNQNLSIVDFCGVWDINYMGMSESTYDKSYDKIINIKRSEGVSNSVLVYGFTYEGTPVNGTIDTEARTLTIHPQITINKVDNGEHWVATFGGINEDNTLGDLVFVMEEGKESMHVVDDVLFCERVEIDDEYAGSYSLGLVLSCEKSEWEYAGQGIVEPGFICAMYGISPVPDNTVEVYTSKNAPGIFRMAGAYSGLFSGEDFYLDMEYPALPKVPYQNTGLIDGQDGITYVMSLTANSPLGQPYTTPEEFLAAGAAVGGDWSDYVPSYDEATRTVVFPGNAILCNWPEGDNPSSLYSSGNPMETKIVLPEGIQVPARSDSHRAAGSRAIPSLNKNTQKVNHPALNLPQANNIKHISPAFINSKNNSREITKLNIK